MTTHTALLELRDVDVRYGAVTALRGLSLAIAPGQIVALLGANGAGKSTTLRAISGLVAPSRGEVLFDGRQIGAPTMSPRADRVAALGLRHVPEGRGIFAEMTVEENLKLGHYLRTDKAQVAADLEEVLVLFPRVRERLKQLAGTLSGGEQQMVAIARALAAKPRLLLLDEPSLGLAPQVTEKIFETIVKINQTGVTVLLVEQNVRLALETAHYALVLETGKIVVQGPSSELLGSEQIKTAYLGD